MPEIWTIKKVLNWTIQHFEKGNVPDARLSAELLLAHALSCNRIDLYLQFERILTPPELSRYRNFIERRSGQEPVQYITGEQEFMGLTFKVNRSVLIPRQETELLVEHILRDPVMQKAGEPNILDVGTGSGVIAISLAHYHKTCRVSAVDISKAALQIAEENALKLGAENITFRELDARKLATMIEEKFDIIAVNPPYVAVKHRDTMHPQILNYEPPEALFAGKDGLDFYRTFIPQASQFLTENGKLYMEIGFDQKADILQLLKHQQFRHIQFIKDYRNIDRIVTAQK